MLKFFNIFLSATTAHGFFFYFTYISNNFYCSVNTFNNSSHSNDRRNSIFSKNIYQIFGPTGIRARQLIILPHITRHLSYGDYKRHQPKFSTNDTKVSHPRTYQCNKDLPDLYFLARLISLNPNVP